MKNGLVLNYLVEKFFIQVKIVKKVQLKKMITISQSDILNKQLNLLNWSMEIL